LLCEPSAGCPVENILNGRFSLSPGEREKWFQRFVDLNTADRSSTEAATAMHEFSVMPSRLPLRHEMGERVGVRWCLAFQNPFQRSTPNLQWFLRSTRRAVDSTSYHVRLSLRSSGIETRLQFLRGGGIFMGGSKILCDRSRFFARVLFRDQNVDRRNHQQRKDRSQRHAGDNHNTD
jgi:hypothetical protein